MWKPCRWCTGHKYHMVPILKILIPSSMFFSLLDLKNFTLPMIWNKLYITGISKPNINTFFWLKHQDTTIMVSCINEENMEISE